MEPWRKFATKVPPKFHPTRGNLPPNFRFMELWWNFGGTLAELWRKFGGTFVAPRKFGGNLVEIWWKVGGTFLGCIKIINTVCLMRPNKSSTKLPPNFRQISTKSPGFNSSCSTASLVLEARARSSRWIAVCCTMDWIDFAGSHVVSRYGCFFVLVHHRARGINAL